MHGQTSRILQSVDQGARGVVSRLQRLQSIGIALSAEPDLRKLLSRILQESRSLTGADSGSIFVREDEVQPVPNPTAKDDLNVVTPYLVLKVAQNDSVSFPFREMRLPFDQKTIAGYVAHRGETVSIEDVYRIPAGSPYSYSTAFDQLSGYRCRSMLVLPMSNRSGEIIGVLQLINKKKDPAARLAQPGDVERVVVPFDEFDEELLLSLASQAGVCIEKAKLYDDIEKMFEGLVTSFTLSLEKRNRTTYGHCMRVAKYALALAEAVSECETPPFQGVRYTPEQYRELRYAALLHDIGKIAVPEAVLDKRNKLLDSEIEAIVYRLRYAKSTAGFPAEKADGWIEHIRKVNIPTGLSDADLELLQQIRSQSFVDSDGALRPLLTDREFENLSIRRGNLTGSERKEIEKHIVDTWEILRRIPWPKDLARVPHVASTHHEKINGSGYPWGFTAKDIPFGGKILALVDIYEALTAKDRPYKPAIPVDKALLILEDEVKRGNLDPDLYRLFVERGVHRMFAGQTGFVHRPSDPTAGAPGK